MSLMFGCDACVNALIKIEADNFNSILMWLHYELSSEPTLTPINLLPITWDSNR